ncbi:SART-1 protein [Myxozyma melibiosi]|uniref:SART-1 protein n=1 Tax=Myxozyma melibiosi TaxID=54550 RepID=A0ABR1FA24_9ASCO
MAEEISLSLEETNKRRIELGLRPIPTDSSSSTPTESAKEPRAAATGDSLDESSLSIEDTNKLRIKLGLRPIPVPGDDASAGDSAPAPDSDEQALANWKAKYEQERMLADAEAARKRIQKSKERIERLRFLDGKGLGDEDDADDVDAKSWVKKAKKKFKISVPADEEEEEESKPEYSASDLRGLKVGHDLADIAGQEEVILTLKDSNVLDDAEDELVSQALEEKAKLAKNIESRKRKAKYSGFEDEDDGKSGVLSRYEEALEEDSGVSSSKKFFTLDSEVISLENKIMSADQVKQKAADEANPGKIRVSLDYDIPVTTSSDYMPAEPVKMKKPKKAKKGSKNGRRRQRDEDDDEATVRDGDNDVVMPDMEGDIIEQDDEDLQALLTKQRRAIQKKKKAQFITPEMLAQSIREQSAAAAGVEDEPAAGEGGELVIDDMTEFVGTVGNSLADEEADRQRLEKMAAEGLAEQQETVVKDEDDDVKMENADPYLESSHIKEEEKDGNASDKDAEDDDDVPTGLGDEPEISVGLGATLSMLRSRGLLKTPDAQDLERQRIQRENLQFKAEMARRRALAEVELKAQREADRRSGKYDGLTQREREDAAQRENTARQIQEGRDAMKRFKDYKPDVKLEYKDEFGRTMTTKEAFKHLSHQFHGKGSGKQKTEKKLKKIADERKKESKSLFS